MSNKPSPLPIVRLGHPALRRKSRPVTRRELVSKKIQRFIDDLAATCLKANGAGIAAPQVGVNKRIIVVHVAPHNPRYPDRPHFPLTIVVNPKVTKKSQKIVDDWEADLSANLRAIVPRVKTCEVTGWNRHGRSVRYLLSGFHARVFQHEIDHLNGVFLTDRAKKETLTEVTI